MAQHMAPVRVGPGEPASLHATLKPHQPMLGTSDMQASRHHINAEEYIRRIDRMVFVTGVIAATLALNLFS
jgi:hypothetical protein